jgi:hypothetical protein
MGDSEKDVVVVAALSRPQATATDASTFPLVALEVSSSSALCKPGTGLLRMEMHAWQQTVTTADSQKCTKLLSTRSSLHFSDDNWACMT